MGLTLKESYEVLGLKEGADEAAIKKAYKKMALKTHPDKNKDDPDASKKFLKVSEAYKRITDPSSFEDDDEYNMDENEFMEEMMGQFAMFMQDMEDFMPPDMMRDVSGFPGMGDMGADMNDIAAMMMMGMMGGGGGMMSGMFNAYDDDDDDDDHDYYFDDDDDDDDDHLSKRDMYGRYGRVKERTEATKAKTKTSGNNKNNTAGSKPSTKRNNLNAHSMGMYGNEAVSAADLARYLAKYDDDEESDDYDDEFQQMADAMLEQGMNIHNESFETTMSVMNLLHGGSYLEKAFTSSSSSKKNRKDKTTKSKETVWEDVDDYDNNDDVDDVEVTYKTKGKGKGKGKNNSSSKNKNKGKKVTDPSSLSLGDTVIVRGKAIGTVLFLGEVHYSTGYFVGVNVGSSGKNDGSVKGQRYFTCPPGEGLLVKLNEVEFLE